MDERLSAFGGGCRASVGSAASSASTVSFPASESKPSCLAVFDSETLELRYADSSVADLFGIRMTPGTPWRSILKAAGAKYQVALQEGPSPDIVLFQDGQPRTWIKYEAANEPGGQLWVTFTDKSEEKRKILEKRRLCSGMRPNVVRKSDLRFK